MHIQPATETQDTRIVVLLDNHGCLTYGQPVLLERLSAALTSLRLDVAKTHLKAILNDAIGVSFRDSLVRIRTVNAEMDAWATVWSQILSELGAPVDDDTVQWLTTQCHYARAITLYPDSMSALQTMIDIARVSIFSNALPALDPVLQRLGVAQHCEQVFISCILGVEKPDPAMFELAFEALEVYHRRAVLIDDTKENVQAAYDWGIAGILLDRNTDAHQSTVDGGIWCCGSLEEAAHLIGHWETEGWPMPVR